MIRSGRMGRTGGRCGWCRGNRNCHERPGQEREGPYGTVLYVIHRVVLLVQSQCISPMSAERSTCIDIVRRRPTRGMTTGQVSDGEALEPVRGWVRTNWSCR